MMFTINAAELRSAIFETCDMLTIDHTIPRFELEMMNTPGDVIRRSVSREMEGKIASMIAQKYSIMEMEDPATGNLKFSQRLYIFTQDELIEAIKQMITKLFKQVKVE
jgi:hypothetical protein